MTDPPEAPAKRKWLPTEAYRHLVLCALAHPRDGPVSKGALAWEVRANHYVITKVLRDLVQVGHVVISEQAGGHRITITETGREFLRETRDYFRSTFGPIFQLHFQYGKRPAWVDL